MRLISFKDADTDRDIWINPIYVVSVLRGPHRGTLPDTFPTVTINTTTGNYVIKASSPEKVVERLLKG